MKKRILSLVLCAAMLLSMCLFLGAGVMDDTTADGSAETTESYVPAVNFTNVAPFVEMNAQVQHGRARAPMLSAASANAANTQLVTNDGVVTTKTATANDDDTYTITLTSYTTGNVKQQQTTKPTDIVLVLDQSGSMDYDMSGSGSTNYNAYLGKAAKNDTLYQQRSNGGTNNLWYWLPSGKYVAVSVDKTDNRTVYTPITKGRNDSSWNGATNYWENRENLYALVDGEWHKVSYTRNRDYFWEDYKCTYSIDGVVINYNDDGVNHSPVFTGIDDGYLYLSGGKGSVYTYYYYDDNGQRVTIGVSDSSANGSFTAAKLYKKVAGGKTRLDALRAAVEQFAAQIAEKAKGPDEKAGTADDVDHRIAIVGFSSDGYNNTELLTGCKIAKSSSDDVGDAGDTKYYPTGYAMNGVQYGKAKTDDYKNALVYMSTDTGRQSVRDAIDALTAHGGTETNKGMDMAKQIFANDSKKGENRNRVVVLFTDGVPGHNYNDGTEKINSTYANPAIKCANDISKNYSATIYTVGIFGGANGENPKSLPANGNWYNGETANSTTANRFMHLVSSNYPDATAMNKPGSVNSSLKNGDSYYLSARDADTLNNIFEKIGNNISTPSIKLGTQAYVQDTVSPYFTAPANESAIEVYTEDAVYDTSNNLTWTNKQPFSGEKSVVDKTVKVTGFDYDKNFVSVTGRDENDSKKDGTFHGRRLVVTFTVKAEDAFLGGNNVPTNVAESSGVYQSDGTVVENFDQPEVNVPIKAPKLKNKDANVYYGGGVPSAEQLCSTAAYDNAMADFVTIRYDTNGTVSNTHDSTYTVTMTVSPKDEAKKTSSGEAAEAQSATVTSTVYVYKPEITYKDSVINLGDTANYTNNFVSTVWKHGEQTSTDADVTMVGIAPELTYTYNPEAGKFTQDTYVNVTVKIGERDIPADVVTFRHDPCTFPGCKYTDDCGYQFYVHINVFDLTIKKTAADGSMKIDENQTFVFHVKGNNNGVDMQVVITGDGQQTIKNLPMGDYTITEDTSWSWKYTPVDKDGAAVPSQTITATGATTVTFENKNNGTNWLTSLAKAINTWAGDRAHEKTN